MTNHLHEIEALGQSIWLDNISRELLDSGKLERLIADDGISGVTSNPSIFEKAIGHSDLYDDSLRAAAAEGLDGRGVFFRLAIQDIRDGADLLRDTWDRTGGSDGHISFELPPELADQVEGSVTAAKHFVSEIDRANLLIKVPGTAAGVEAFRELTAIGISVNVTLLFAVERYEEIAQAYIAGLERRVAEGKPVERPCVGRELLRLARRRQGRRRAREGRAQRPAGEGGDRQRARRLRVVPADLLGTALGGARGARAPACRSRSGRRRRPRTRRTGHALRRRADRAGHGQHDARPDHRAARDHGTARRTIDRDVPAPTGCSTRFGPRASTSTGSARSSSSRRASRPSRRRSTTSSRRSARRAWRLRRQARPRMAELAVENPLRVGLRLSDVPGPCALVIFGGSGDLAHRKLVPALYNLALRGLLPAGFGVVGIGRCDYGGDEGFRQEMRASVSKYSRTQPLDETVWDSFAEGSATCVAASRRRRCTRSSGERLGGLDNERGTSGNAVFYLATPPTTFPTIVAGLGQAGLSQEEDGHFRRLVIEKPFGHDLASAIALNTQVHEAFEREPGLPDRPLPGQGDGPEHPGPALRATASSSRSGTAATSTTCRSPWPRRSASRAAAASTRRRARSATWSRTTCCRCSRSWRWSRPRPSRPRRCATRRPRCSRAVCGPMRTHATSCAASTRPASCEGVPVPGYRRGGGRRARTP